MKLILSSLFPSKTSMTFPCYWKSRSTCKNKSRCVHSLLHSITLGVKTRLIIFVRLFVSSCSGNARVDVRNDARWKDSISLQKRRNIIIHRRIWCIKYKRERIKILNLILRVVHKSIRVIRVVYLNNFYSRTSYGAKVLWIIFSNKCVRL